MTTKSFGIKSILAFSAVLALVLAGPLQAGIYYESVTTGERPRDTVRVKSWVEGEQAKIEFEDGGNQPFMSKGSYLLTQDGGRTLYLVDPKEKTYSRWDLEAMLQTFGQVMEAMGPMMNISIDNAQVEELGQEAGGTLVGLPTTRYRYRTSYDLNMKIMGMKRGQHVEMEQEIWSTDAVVAPGLGVWLRAFRPTGFEGLDELVQAEMDKLRGFPLKTVTVTTMTNKKGKQNTTRSTMEVTVLDQSRTIPDATFEIPAGYQETEMIPTQEGQAGDEDGKGKNPLKKLFGGGG